MIIYFLFFDKEELRGLSSNTKEWVRLSENKYSFNGHAFKIKDEDNARYSELSKKLTVDDLIKLTDYPNPQIRVFAYARLFYKKLDNKIELVKKAIKDTSLLSYKTGCTNSYDKVNHYIMNSILFIETESDEKLPPYGKHYQSFGLTPEHIKEIKACYKLYNLK